MTVISLGKTDAGIEGERKNNHIMLVFLLFQAFLSAVVGGQEVSTVVSTSDLAITTGLVR